MRASKVQNILFFTIMILVFLLFLYLPAPFFFPIFWAAVISSIFSPLYKYLNRKLHNPSAAAAIIFLVVAARIILPGSIIGSVMLGESMRMYESIDADGGNIENIVEGLTGVLPKIIPLWHDFISTNNSGPKSFQKSPRLFPIISLST